MKKQTANLQYVGSFSTLQNQSSKRLMSYKKKNYTPRQNELYGRLLIGLNFYEKEQLFNMNSTKKQRIVKAHKKAQQILNRWKHELTIKKTNEFFMTFFPGSGITETLLNHIEPVDDFKNTLAFKDLGITKEHIIQKLLEERLLPNNFDSL